AETKNIYHALKINSSSNTKNYIIIISYSLSTLTLISNPYPRNKLVKLIFEINNPKCFMWVSSHIGIPENEKSETIVFKAI
ncbi:putative RNA-directed DNA polymerase, partial [Aphis craccivora]